MTPRPQLADILVSVVLPVYNEVEVLKRLTERVIAALLSVDSDWELVFVDDGSQDGSGELLDGIARLDERIRVIHFSRNFGHQAAVQAGLEHARGDVVVLMDSDLQDSPEAIGHFLAEWRDGYDVVYAVRADRKEAWWKRMLFGGFYRVLSAISSTRMPCDAGNFGLLDRRVVDQIKVLGERDRYFPGLRSWVGFRQRGVTVERLARYDDSPRVSLFGLWKLAKTAIYSFSSFPLKVFSLIGYSALALFLGLGCYSLFCKLFTDLAIPGWTSQLLCVSFFGALNAMGISILGEYVIRIYDQVRQRPTYIVERTVNMESAATPVASTAAEDAPYLAVLAEARQIAAESQLDEGLRWSEEFELAACGAQRTQPAEDGASDREEALSRR